MKRISKYKGKKLPRYLNGGEITSEADYNKRLLLKNKSKEELNEQNAWIIKRNKKINTEQKLDNYLGNPLDRAHVGATDFLHPEEDEKDNLRHSLAGRYVTEAIANKTGNIPFISKGLGVLGANVLGVAHELYNFPGDTRDLKTKLRESGEDMFNNFAGSMVGASTLNTAQKNRVSMDLANKVLPDGYGETDPFRKGLTNNYALPKHAQGGKIDTYKNPGSTDIVTPPQEPLDVYMTKLGVLKSEQERVNQVRNNIIPTAQTIDNNPNPQTFLRGAPTEGNFCNAYTGECYNRAGLTTAQDFLLNGRTVKAGSSMPMIPGNLQQESVLNQEGFVQVPLSEIQPGDNIKKQYYSKGLPWQGPVNPNAQPHWISGHSMIYKGPGANNTQEVYNSPGDRNTFEKRTFQSKDWVGNINNPKEQDSRLIAYRYVGNIPELEKQTVEARKASLANSKPLQSININYNNKPQELQLKIPNFKALFNEERQNINNSKMGAKKKAEMLLSIDQREKEQLGMYQSNEQPTTINQTKQSNQYKYGGYNTSSINNNIISKNNKPCCDEKGNLKKKRGLPYTQFAIGGEVDTDPDGSETKANPMLIQAFQQSLANQKINEQKAIDAKNQVVPYSWSPSGPYGPVKDVTSATPTYKGIDVSEQAIEQSKLRKEEKDRQARKDKITYDQSVGEHGSILGPINYAFKKGDDWANSKKPGGGYETAGKALEFAAMSAMPLFEGVGLLKKPITTAAKSVYNSAARSVASSPNVVSSIDDVGKEVLERRAFLQNLKDKKLIHPNTDINHFSQSDDLVSNLTKDVVNQQNTYYRGVKGNLPTDPKALEAMKQAGVDLTNKESIGKYYATHIKHGELDYGSGFSTLNSNHNALYTSPGYANYGDMTFQMKKATDFSKGNYKDWIDDLYKYEDYDPNVFKNIDDVPEWTRTFRNSSNKIAPSNFVGKKGQRIFDNAELVKVDDAGKGFGRTKSYELPGSSNTESFLERSNLERQGVKTKSNIIKENIQEGSFKINLRSTPSKGLVNANIKSPTGIIQANRNPDGSYGLSFEDANPFNAGKSMLKLKEKLAGKTIYETKSFSTDSYTNILKLKKKLSFEETGFVPLNSSNKVNNFLDDLVTKNSKEWSASAKFKSEDAAIEGAKRMDDYMLKLGETTKSKVVNNNGKFEVHVPNYKIKVPEINNISKELIESEKLQQKKYGGMINYMANGGMIKRADESYSQRGLWDNIRANAGSGKAPTAEMLKQEAKINKMAMGGYMMYGNGGTNNPGFNALPEEVQQNILANMAMGGQMNNPMFANGGKLPQDILESRLESHMSTNEVNDYLDKYGEGGYVVKRSSDRKGKTHVVIGPDGTEKYFGDPNMGQKENSKNGEEAFYARHKTNLANNPYFRAYARKTWAMGGMTMKQEIIHAPEMGGYFRKK